MRILMISDVYFPRVNGVSTSIQTYRADLLGLGHEVTLVVPEYPAAGRVSDDADIVRLPSRRVPRDPEDRAMSSRALVALAPRLRQRRYDLVHVQTPFVAHYAGLALARQLNLPVVESYHTYFEHYLHHYVPALPAGLMRWFARRFTVAQCGAVRAVIAPSLQMADALRAYGVKTPIEVLPTGLPPASFEPGDGPRFRARQRIPSQRPVALFVGRVAHEKNIDFLIRMLADLQNRVPDILLIIAGEGPAEQHLRRLVEQLGLGSSVLFIGYMDRARDLPDCYAAADAFVFASRTETQGLVLLEALAQGTPVVSTAVMGTVDVLAGALGAVVVAEQVPAFASAVADVVMEPERRAALSRAAIDDARRWSSRGMAQRLVAFYGSALGAAASERATTVDARLVATTVGPVDTPPRAAVPR
jgi:1,2-diacylglycerol 3-alpha-glucosyltransferase